MYQMISRSAPPTYPTANNFDVLRLLMAFLVLLSHGAELFGFRDDRWLFHQAELAVHGFFIMSGFLISWSIMRSAHAGFSLKNYAFKRICRIYPLYAVVISVQLVILALFDTGATPMGAMLRYYITNLATLNFLQPSVGTMLAEPINGTLWAMNGSLWTIKIELMFYAVMPLYLWCCVRFGGWFMLASFIIAFTYRYGLPELISPRLARQLPGAMTYFITGAAFYFYASIMARTYWLWLAALAAIIAALLHYAAPALVDAWLMLIILATCLYGLAFHAPIIRMPLDISYGVYLWHMPTFLTLHHLFGAHLTPLTVWCAGSVLVLVLATISAHYIEQPAIRWAKARVKAWR